MIDGANGEIYWHVNSSLLSEVYLNVIGFPFENRTVGGKGA